MDTWKIIILVLKNKSEVSSSMLMSSKDKKVFLFPQFSSVTQLCLILCDPMECSTPVFPVHHQLLELTQTYVHRVGDAIKPSHPLSSLFPPALNLSKHQVPHPPKKLETSVKWLTYQPFLHEHSHDVTPLVGTLAVI